MQKILEIAITIYSGKDNLYKEELEESIGIIVNMIFTHYVLIRGKWFVIQQRRISQKLYLNILDN